MSWLMVVTLPKGADMLKTVGRAEAAVEPGLISRRGELETRACGWARGRRVVAVGCFAPSRTGVKPKPLHGLQMRVLFRSTPRCGYGAIAAGSGSRCRWVICDAGVSLEISASLCRTRSAFSMDVGGDSATYTT